MSPAVAKEQQQHDTAEYCLHTKQRFVFIGVSIDTGVTKTVYIY